MASHTCAEHRELAGELLRAGMPGGRKLDRWLPASVRWSPPQQQQPPGPAYQLTITLDEIYPPVWRRIHVPAGMSLAALHDVVVVAMGWEGYHLWRFGMLTFGDVHGEHDPATTLEMVLRKPGDRLGYLYDFGDLWVHHIALDKVITRPRATLPRCTAGKRACPPEDCGGPWGYDETLKALRARKGWLPAGPRVVRDQRSIPNDSTATRSTPAWPPYRTGEYCVPLCPWHSSGEARAPDDGLALTVSEAQRLLVAVALWWQSCRCDGAVADRR